MSQNETSPMTPVYIDYSICFSYNAGIQQTMYVRAGPVHIALS